VSSRLSLLPLQRAKSADHRRPKSRGRGPANPVDSLSLCEAFARLSAGSTPAHLMPCNVACTGAPAAPCIILTSRDRMLSPNASDHRRRINVRAGAIRRRGAKAFDDGLPHSNPRILGRDVGYHDRMTSSESPNWPSMQFRFCDTWYFIFFEIPNARGCLTSPGEFCCRSFSALLVFQGRPETTLLRTGSLTHRKIGKEEGTRPGRSWYGILQYFTHVKSRYIWRLTHNDRIDDIR
jgi:hypothetical protein